MQIAVDATNNAELGDNPPVPRRPAPHLVELHTAVRPAGVRSQDQEAILKRVGKLLQDISEAAEKVRRADEFGTLDDRLQAAMLYLYDQKAFDERERIVAPQIVNALSSSQARKNLPEIESRVNDLTKLIAPHRPKLIESVHGRKGGYYLTMVGRRFVLAALHRLTLDPKKTRWPADGFGWG